MKVSLTDHAKTRLLERDIDTHQAIKLVKADLKTNKILGDKVEVKGRTDNGRDIGVVYIALSKNKVTIITAYNL